jgi:hypothetical protein
MVVSTQGEPRLLKKVNLEYYASTDWTTLYPDVFLCILIRVSHPFYISPPDAF